MSQAGVFDKTTAKQDIETVTTDDATVVVPDSAGNINLAGGKNMNTTGSGDTATVVLNDDVLNLTRLTVDNLDLNGNVISSTNTNGNIQVDLDGTGTLAVSKGGTFTPDSSNYIHTEGSGAVYNMIEVDGATSEGGLRIWASLDSSPANNSDPVVQWGSKSGGGTPDRSFYMGIDASAGDFGDTMLVIGGGANWTSPGSGDIFYINEGNRNVGLGQRANASALLDVTSTTQGFRLPRMTTTQRNNIGSPANGLVVFNTTTDDINFYDGTSWKDMAAVGGSDTEIQFNNSGDLDGISTLTYDGTNVTSTRGITIDGSSDEIQLLLQGHGTQTTNILEIETSAASNLLTFDNSGVATITGQLNVDNVRLDGSTVSLGSGQDATINYDGTNLIINPRAVGTGHLDVQGELIGWEYDFSDQTGTSYTVVENDGGKILTFNNPSDITVTLPQNSTTALREGFHFLALNKGDGRVTFVKEGADIFDNVTPYLDKHDQCQIYLETSGTPNTWRKIGGTEFEFIQYPLLIETVANQDYMILLRYRGAHDIEITETSSVAASGSCTATFKINSTALGGTANSVSTTEETQSHNSNNIVRNGDDIKVTVSANSSCLDMSLTVTAIRRK